MDTVSPAELRAILTLTSKAPSTVGDTIALQDVIAKFVALANQSHPIGAIVPAETPELASSDSLLSP
jgi:hypothetical protein